MHNTRARALWVENMNSVMDDNRLLTLPNGERIRLNFPTTSMLYEVFDLQYASPATISRCGMVYVDPKDIGWQPYTYRWLNSRENAAEQEVMRGLFDKYLQVCVDYVVEGIEDKASMTMVDPLKQAIPMTDLSLIQQLCKVLDSQLGVGEAATITEPPLLEAVFMLCLTWSLGGALVQPARVTFDRYIKKLSGLPLQDRGEEINVGALPNSLATLHDWSLDLTEKKWRPWSSKVPAYEPPTPFAFSSIVVPTADTVRTTWLVDSVAAIRGAVLLVGDSGTAKTTVVASYLGTRDPDSTSLLTVNFSSRTSSKDVQVAVEDSLEKRTKDTYGPPAGKRLMMFIDDLNMPLVDTYGTQQPVALLKLLIDKGFLYDRGKELSIKYIKEMQFIGAMVPARCPYGVDPRFVRLFSVFNVAFPPESSIRGIYSTILETFFNTGAFDKSMQGADLATRVTSVMMDVFNAVVASLPPTPAKFHYIFNLRDLSRMTEGVMQAVPDTYTGAGAVGRLLWHELLRILSDRMVGDDDKRFVGEQVEKAFQQHFSSESAAVLADPCLYADFLNYHKVEEEAAAGGGDTLRLYEDVKDHATIKPVLDEIIEKYNMKNKAMNLVLFDDCLDHLVRVHRLMRLPRGNALLVGVGGSGKQSITRLAAYTAQNDIFSITLTRGYNEQLFREDLKNLYGMIVDKPVAFLFTDNHVADEGFLELINNMLSSGMVPALFEESERDGIINNIRDEVTKKGLPDSKEAVWQYYVNKCRDVSVASRSRASS